MKSITNAEALIKVLQDVDDEEILIFVTSYINCPYTCNPNCNYDGGKNDECCDECKMDWLKKDFEG